jgi:hypothetical protein
VTPVLHEQTLGAASEGRKRRDILSLPDPWRQRRCRGSGLHLVALVMAQTHRKPWKEVPFAFTHQLALGCLSRTCRLRN